jgi:hypothetical protein
MIRFIKAYQAANPISTPRQVQIAVLVVCMMLSSEGLSLNPIVRRGS